MSRSLWFVAGAGAGVYAMARARRVAEALTVDGMRDRLGAFGVGARMFREEMSAGAAEKETELRTRMGLTPLVIPANRELTSALRTTTTEHQTEDTDGHQ